MSFTSLIATLVSVLFLWNDGLWLAVATVPYSLAYLFYRGAVVTAHEYGTAVAALVDLNRFTLYERLHLPLPEDIDEELKLNERLSSVLDFNKTPGLLYLHSDLPSSSNKTKKTLASRFVRRLFHRT